MVVWVRWGVAVLSVFCDFFLFLNGNWPKMFENERKSYPQKLSTLEIAAVGPTNFLTPILEKKQRNKEVKIIDTDLH